MALTAARAGFRPAAVPAAFLTALLLFAAAGQAAAFDSRPDFLTLELWVELAPAVSEVTEAAETPFEEILPMTARTLGGEEAARRLLEEARFVISGMIYGYRLEYTPMDRARQVEELFSAEPVALIPQGDPDLHVQDTWRRDGMFFARVRYDLDEAQLLRLRAWSSAVHERASGSASAPLSLGYRGKMEAHRLAVKEAFREYLRSIERNKPRAAAARAVLSESPVSAVSAGGYRSTVRVRLALEEVRSYGAY